MSEPANVGVFDNIAVHSPSELTLTADITDPQFASLVGQPGLLVNGGFRPNLNVSTQQSQADAWVNTSRYMPAGTLPYAIQWNLGSNKQDYTVEVRYLGTRCVHLPMQQQIDKASPVTATQNIPTLLSAPSAAVLASLALTTGALRAQGNLLPLYKAAGFWQRDYGLTTAGLVDIQRLGGPVDQTLHSGPGTAGIVQLESFDR